MPGDANIYALLARQPQKSILKDLKDIRKLQADDKHLQRLQASEHNSVTLNDNGLIIRETARGPRCYLPQILLKPLVSENTSCTATDKLPEQQQSQETEDGATGPLDPIMTRSKTKNKNKKTADNSDRQEETHQFSPSYAAATTNPDAVYERFTRRCEQHVRQIGEELTRAVNESIQRLEKLHLGEISQQRNEQAGGNATSTPNNNAPCARDDSMASQATQSRPPPPVINPVQQPFVHYPPVQPNRPYGLQPTKLAIPTFSGAEYEKPVKFLRDFMDYYNAVGLTEYHFYHVVKQALQGQAAEWWEHVNERITSIPDFQRRFKERFWSRMIQARKREKLETGYYYADKNQSRSEYVIAIYNQIKALDTPPSEIDMIEKFSRHFDTQTQNAIVSQRIHRVDELIGTVIYNNSIISKQHARAARESTADARLYGSVHESREQLTCNIRTCDNILKFV
ncbi:unnamed protein product [Trichogramma brassicae]|uniref:Retrotransposon gag domain-containing protein n=1 Tax=Trichogramma brassicae TaxID=86971 RepID=A0A6H5HV87_9HYME|nr:unnamed protein product [Trichogramma brassicae]